MVMVLPFTLTPRPAEPVSFNGMSRDNISLFFSEASVPSSPDLSVSGGAASRVGKSV
jgi:hypothetical protein